jgi:hypothetical protein
LENAEEKCVKIWKIQTKSKLNREKIWKIQEKIVKRYENTDENCEMLWKIWKKIVKRFGKYRGKVG